MAVNAGGHGQSRPEGAAWVQTWRVQMHNGNHQWRAGATVGAGYDSANQAVEPLMEMALRYATMADPRH